LQWDWGMSMPSSPAAGLPFCFPWRIS
jgi:hypothetical protein